MSLLREVIVSPTGTQKELLYERLKNTGSDAMNVNGSVTEVVFSVTPPTGEIWRIKEWSLYIQDNGTFDASLWGNGITLANGIELRLNGVAIVPFGIKSTGELAGIAEISHHAFGSGHEIITARWKIVDSAGQYMRLTDADSLEIAIRDDLTLVVAQNSMVIGYKE